MELFFSELGTSPIAPIESKHQLAEFLFEADGQPLCNFEKTRTLEQWEIDASFATTNYWGSIRRVVIPVKPSGEEQIVAKNLLAEKEGGQIQFFFGEDTVNQGNWRIFPIVLNDLNKEEQTLLIEITERLRRGDDLGANMKIMTLILLKTHY